MKKVNKLGLITAAALVLGSVPVANAFAEDLGANNVEVTEVEPALTIELASEDASNSVTEGSSESKETVPVNETENPVVDSESASGNSNNSVEEANTSNLPTVEEIDKSFNPRLIIIEHSEKNMLYGAFENEPFDPILRIDIEEVYPNSEVNLYNRHFEGYVYAGYGSINGETGFKSNMATVEYLSTGAETVDFYKNDSYYKNINFDKYKDVHIVIFKYWNLDKVLKHPDIYPKEAVELAKSKMKENKDPEKIPNTDSSGKNENPGVDGGSDDKTPIAPPATGGEGSGEKNPGGSNGGNNGETTNPEVPKGDNSGGKDDNKTPTTPPTTGGEMEVKPDVKPDVKPGDSGETTKPDTKPTDGGNKNKGEDKGETKPDTKPEIKPDVKPEFKPGDKTPAPKPEVTKPSEGGSMKTETPSVKSAEGTSVSAMKTPAIATAAAATLPETGEHDSIFAEVVAMIALMFGALVVAFRKKRELISKK